MTETKVPERIYISPAKYSSTWYAEKTDDHTVAYVRADLFDEVVGALEVLLGGLPIFPESDNPETRIEYHHLGLLTVGQRTRAGKLSRSQENPAMAEER